MIIILHPNFK